MTITTSRGYFGIFFCSISLSLSLSLSLKNIESNGKRYNNDRRGGARVGGREKRGGVSLFVSDVKYLDERNASGAKGSTTSNVTDLLIPATRKRS